ncbi:MAG: tail fiber domain-containing protein, partial [Candidatus Aenigmarchaeota archaeon]|nr:tail fiber domain-containing protein [Candidatus Aenigmarchaeota archaeon]
SLNYNDNLIGWSNLTAYPAACPAGQFITALGDSITCQTPASASANSGWVMDGTSLYNDSSDVKVGIGTNLPTARLNVIGSDSINKISLNISNTFFVNETNNFVGIKTSNPQSALNVYGDLSLTSLSEKNPGIIIGKYSDDFSDNSSKWFKEGFLGSNISFSSGNLILNASRNLDCYGTTINCTRMSTYVDNNNRFYILKINDYSNVNWAQYAIVLWQDNSNFITFEIDVDASSTYSASITRTIAGTGSNMGNANLGTRSSQPLLIVQKYGDSYYFYVSRNSDESWTRIGSLTQTGFTVNKASVAIFNGNVFANMSVDYFLISELGGNILAGHSSAFLGRLTVIGPSNFAGINIRGYGDQEDPYIDFDSQRKGDTDYEIYLYQNSDGADNDNLVIAKYNDTNFKDILYITSNERVGIDTANPTTKLYVNYRGDSNVLTVNDTTGSCTINPGAGAGWSCTSDLKLKKNISDLKQGLKIIKELNPVTFNLKEDDGKVYTGFIAQDVEKILPLLVTDDNNYKMLNQEGMIPYLVAAIKEQQDEIENLKRENKIIMEKLCKFDNSFC